MMNINLTTTHRRPPTWLQGLFILLLALLPIQAMADEPFEDRACEVNNHPDSVTKCYQNTGNVSFYCSWTSIGQARWYVDGVLTWTDPDAAASGSTYVHRGRFDADIRCKWSSIFCGEKWSNYAILTVWQAPVVTRQPVDVASCVGASSVTFSISTNVFQPGQTYQWRKGSVNLTDQAGKYFYTKGPALTVYNISSNDAGGYSCFVSNSCGSVTSNSAQLTINGLPVITDQPDSQTVCPGSTVSLVAAVASSSPVTYRWFKSTAPNAGGVELVNGPNVFGATTRELVLFEVQADAAGYYTCFVSNACSTVGAAAALVTVSGTPTITAQPLLTTVCSGTNTTLSVTATSTSTLSYQWAKDGVDLVDGNGVSGVTTRVLSLSSVDAGDTAFYRCRVSTSCGSVLSDSARLFVNTLAITTQPTALAQCPGTTAVFSVAATGTPTPTFRWRKGSTDLSDVAGQISGATTATLTLSSIDSNDSSAYSCVVTNSCVSITSNLVVLTVNSAPTISTQPAALSKCPGTEAVFSVEASGTPAPTFQWRKGTTNLSNAAGQVSGATTATLTLSAIDSNDAGSYSCVVSTPCSSVTTSFASLSVNSAPTITTQPVALTQCSGTNAVFSVTATGTPNPTFQWRKGTTNLSNAAGQVSGATTASLTVLAVDANDAGTYRCVITNSCGTSTSTDAVLVINTGPAITTQPVDAAGCYSLPASFTVAATGTTPAFKWQWLPQGSATWLDLSNGSNSYLGSPRLTVTGATASTLQATPLAGAGSLASFRCVLGNTCSSATSNPAAILLCVSDLTCDGMVEDADFQSFVVAYDRLDCADPTMPANCPADLNRDGVVDDSDFQVFVMAYDQLICFPPAN
jgi:hypothetical protein